MIGARRASGLQSAAAFGVLLAISGCTTVSPGRGPKEHLIANRIVVNEPLDKVWATLVRHVSASFFTVNNIEKESGFLNVSYAGAAQEYVDCGTLKAGDVEYTRAASLTIPAGLGSMDRSIGLSGKANVLVQEVDANQTEVTVNVRYVLDYEGTFRFGNEPPQVTRDSISFSTGETGGSGSLTCVATGALEAAILKPWSAAP